MINIIICDDVKEDLNETVRVVDKFLNKNKIDYNMHIFNDYNEDFKKFTTQKLNSKIYILDIETPSGSGIDIARLIRKTDMRSVIIFLTGHEELGNLVLKNDLMSLGFINKFDNRETRLINCLEKSLKLLDNNSIMKFTDRNNTYTIDLNDILYFTKESFERKTIIVTDYTEFKVNNTLAELIDLADKRFVQTHRACFVNKERVAKIDKQNRIITFDNGETTNLLSDKYKKEL